jgi:hypothetical protein
MKRQIWRADHEGDEGELGIAIPQGCIVRANTGRTPATATATEQGPRLDEFEPFTIAVEYEVTKPGLGIVVVGPDDANPSVSFFRDSLSARGDELKLCTGRDSAFPSRLYLVAVRHCRPDLGPLLRLAARPLLLGSRVCRPARTRRGASRAEKSARPERRSRGRGGR